MVGAISAFARLVPVADALVANGAIKQDADVADLIQDCAETIAYVSRLDRRLPGDAVEFTIAGREPLRVTIGEKEAAFA